MNLRAHRKAHVCLDSIFPPPARRAGYESHPLVQSILNIVFHHRASVTSVCTDTEDLSCRRGWVLQVANCAPSIHLRWCCFLLGLCETAKHRINRRQTPIGNNPTKPAGKCCLHSKMSQGQPLNERVTTENAPIFSCSHYDQQLGLCWTDVIANSWGMRMNESSGWQIVHDTTSPEPSGP